MENINRGGAGNSGQVSASLNWLVLALANISLVWGPVFLELANNTPSESHVFASAEMVEGTS